MRERHYVVLGNDIRSELIEDLLEARVDVLRTLDQFFPNRLGKGFELLDRGPAELGRGVANEILLELALGCSSVVGFGFQRRSASSKPFASSVPAKDSSTTNTTRAAASSRRCRCPRSC